MRVYYNSITLVYHTRVTKRAGHRPGPGQGPASNRPGSWAVPARGREGSGTFPERVREGSGHESDPESGLRPSLAADVRPVVWPPAGRAASAASVRLGSPAVPGRAVVSGAPRQLGIAGPFSPACSFCGGAALRGSLPFRPLLIPPLPAPATNKPAFTWSGK